MVSAEHLMWMGKIAFGSLSALSDWMPAMGSKPQYLHATALLAWFVSSKITT